MKLPVNLDSVCLETTLADWLGVMREFAVEAVVVLGPDPFGGRDDRQVMAVYPPGVLDAARTLADSDDFGASWRESDAPMVAWQHIAKTEQLSSCSWRMQWLAHGLQSLVRVEFSLPAGRAFECFLFSPREFNNRSEAAELVWSALNIWPVVRRGISQSRCTLTRRERECLALAFHGLTARASAEQLKCSDRTVNYHLANAMAKLKVDNKMAAIQRACWVGAI